MQSTADAATTSPSIDRLLAYENAGLIARMQNKLGIGHAEALALFDDTKRFLYLCGTVAPPLAPPERIDECWHHFILFTQDYASFCERYFGRFIHHLPKSPEDTARSDGSVMRTTLAHAGTRFGEPLSANWDFGHRVDCKEKCSPSSSCETPTCTSDGK
jgi:hypothetical protein